MDIKKIIVDKINESVKQATLASILVVVVETILNLLGIALGIIKLPYDCWAKSIKNIAGEKNIFCTDEELGSAAKFLTFIKKFVLGSVVDFAVICMFFVGIVRAIKDFCDVVSYDGGEACKIFLLVLVTYYVSTAIIYIVRATCVVIVDKFLSWAGKPAQYVDVNVNKAE